MDIVRSDPQLSKRVVFQEFKDQKIKEYLGDINYFLEERKASDMRDFEQKKDSSTQVKKEVVVKQQKSLSYDDQKRLKTLNNKLRKAESNITDLEKKIAKADLELAEDYEKLMNDAKWFAAYEKLKKDLDTTMVEWEQVQEEIDSVQ